MKRVLICFTYVMMLLAVPCPLWAQSGEDASPQFSVETGRYAGTTLPYRRAIINPTAAQPSLVIYLHGGTSKGTDNAAPLTEAGVDSITSYLLRAQLSAVVLVPQCPKDKSWGGIMNAVVKALIDQHVAQANVDPTRIYLLGGSMGGTGTWSFLSAYPHLLAAAMPVAGNPSKAVADSVAFTPLYTVMGTADAIMSIPTVTAFTEALRDAGGELRYDIEPDWTHEQTCIESYTTPRLDWLFAHVRSSSSAATSIAIPVRNGAYATSAEATSAVQYFSLAGQRLSAPPLRGTYIERSVAADGSASTRTVLRP